VAPLILREVYRHIIDTSAQSPTVTGVELLLLDEPVLKLRVHLGTVAFVEIFFNAETGKTSFALIKDRQRIFGADNTRGWHMHPFNSPESHHRCEEISFENFLRQVEQNKDKWFEAKPNA
jgi:hypothetical protein